MSLRTLSFLASSSSFFLNSSSCRRSSSISACSCWDSLASLGERKEEGRGEGERNGRKGTKERKNERREEVGGRGKGKEREYKDMVALVHGFPSFTAQTTVAHLCTRKQWAEALMHVYMNTVHIQWKEGTKGKRKKEGESEEEEKRGDVSKTLPHQHRASLTFLVTSTFLSLSWTTAIFFLCLKGQRSTSALISHSTCNYAFILSPQFIYHELWLFEQMPSFFTPQVLT